MKKIFKKIPTLLFFLFCAFILAISIRGIQGNPTRATINQNQWKEQGPLELSPDRGRFALTMSVIEDNSVHFTLPIARFATPDLGYANGKYVSLFAPGVSYMIIPGYIVGKMFGAAQVGAFAVIALFALCNTFLIRAISIRLGANSIAATIGAAVFLFATPAFSYAVSLYQHHISTFLILLSIFALLRWNNFWSLSLVWFLFFASIPVDNPNLVLMFPIALFALGRIMYTTGQEQKITVNIKYLYIFTFISAILPLAFFLWFNTVSNGNPLQLSGTVGGVKAIDKNGRPTAPETATAEEREYLLNPDKQEKSATGFFQTRNLLNGFYVHFFSPDRGVIFYTPVILFGVWGMYILYKKDQKITTLFAGIIGANILLYSMWHDPWGGWAFGSRYLIPSYAVLSIPLALFLTKLNKKTIILIFFFLVLAYSTIINSMGALTSNANPHFGDAKALELQSNKEEKYTYERNWDLLTTNSSKSFVWRTYLKEYLTAIQYYYSITSVLLIVSLTLLVVLRLNKYEK